MNERTFRANDAHKLDEPERLSWLPPDDVLSRLGVAQGMTVADVGAGTGYFTLPLAQAVGASGRVYALDVQQEMLDLLRAKLSRASDPGNVVLLRGEALRTPLPDRSCDLVFVANVWHELDDHTGVLREANRLLRAGGRLAILDWRADLLPPPGPPARHRIARDAVEATLSAEGWSLRYSGDIGAYGYLLIALRPEA